MSYHEYFPQVYIELQREMIHHPLLIQRLQKHVGLGVEVIFAELCHYCNYAVDGEFTEPEIQKMAGKLLEKLRTMKVLGAKPPASFLSWQHEVDWSKYYKH